MNATEITPPQLVSYQGRSLELEFARSIIPGLLDGNYVVSQLMFCLIKAVSKLHFYVTLLLKPSGYIQRRFKPHLNRL